MGRGKRYALLDTDFLFKSHLAQDTSHNTLADIIITFEEYEFFCHEMILDELSRHQITPDPLAVVTGPYPKWKGTPVHRCGYPDGVESCIWCGREQHVYREVILTKA